MWTVVYITPDPKEAEMIRDHLSQEGILVRLRSTGSESKDGPATEIMVPEAEVDEALEVLNTL